MGVMSIYKEDYWTCLEKVVKVNCWDKQLLEPRQESAPFHPPDSETPYMHGSSKTWANHSSGILPCTL